MSDLVFWKEWSPGEKRVFMLLAGTLLVVMLLYCIGLFRGSDNALEWHITSQAETIEVPVKSFAKGLFEFELKADNYLINQYYSGSELKTTPAIAYGFFSIFTGCLVVLITISTYLQRFSYLIATGFVCFIFVSLRLEQLEVFGWIDNTFLLIVLALILPVSYYFHSYRPHTTFALRLVAFAACFLLFGLIVGLFSQTSSPLYYLANYNYTAPVVISILFIFLVSHEIVYLILYLITGASGGMGKNGVGHFIVLSLLYLGNVLLVYLRNARYIDWDIIYVNAFFLLIISSAIGVWGFKQRENRYENILPFRPYGAYFFLTIGIICFSTIGFHIVTINDPVLETFEDAIVFSHFGFGLMFLLYILSNFINLIGKNLAVYKVAYKEDNMPYFSANIGGLVIVAAFYFLSNQAALQQAFAGYYNGLGSVYAYVGNDFLAGEYYKRGAIYGYNNHRSNYSLGALAHRQDNPDEAIRYFRDATQKNPTEYAYINLASAQQAESKFFEALFTLREGVEVFPKSERITNNLGLMFKKTNILDSAIFYMEQGTSGSWGNRTNTTNIVDLLARNQVALPADSLNELYTSSTHLPLKSNLLAYSNNTNHWITDEKLDQPADSSLDLHQFAYLHNYAFSKLWNAKGNDQNLIDDSALSAVGALFNQQLRYLRSLHKYQQGDLNGFFRDLDLLRTDPVRSGYFNHVLGLIALEQNAPLLASDYFREALEDNYEGARANLAIALTEAGRLSEAIGHWNQLLTEDSLEVANDVLVVLTAPLELIRASDNDALKYQAIRYRKTFTLSEQIGLLETIEEDNFLIGGMTAVIENLIEIGQLDDALDQFNLLEALVGDNEATSMADLKFRLIVYQVIDQNLPGEFIKERSISQFWLQSDPQARQFFRDMGMNNPFNEGEVIVASRYFRDQVLDQDLAYGILLNGLEINPHSVRIRKAYVLQAVQIGQSNYALEEMAKLSGLISAEAYDEFERQVRQAIRDFDNFVFPQPPSS